MFSINDFQIPTMPGAVPGAGGSGGTNLGGMSTPVAPPSPPPFPTSGGSLPPAPAPTPAPTPSPVSSPMGGLAMPAPAPIDPASMQYDAETQVDGTVLLRVKSPDGQKGPVIQIISPKQPKAPKA